MAEVVIIQGSPRSGGECFDLATALDHYYRSAGRSVEVITPALLHFSACDGCESCIDASCKFDDDFTAVFDAVSGCDELIIVSPVYFSGPPAVLKAALDRFQPHFHAGTRFSPKRPVDLYIVGDGGDPHGYKPLETIVKSACAVAGFSLRDTHAFIGSAKHDWNPIEGIFDHE